MTVSGYTSKTRAEAGYTKAGSSKTAAAESSPVTKTETAKKEDSKEASSSSNKSSSYTAKPMKTAGSATAARRKKIHDASKDKQGAKKNQLFQKKRGYQK